IYLALGNKPGTPLADVRVRRAMYLAINEDEIIAKIMGGQAVPAAQIPDSACAGFDPTLKRLPYDPEKAKALLKEAGYPDGFEITLAGPNDRYVNDAKIAEAAVQYLNKVGIKAKLDVKPKSIFFPEVSGGEKHQFYLLGWLDGAYDSARGLTTNVVTYNKEKGSGGWNGARFSSPEIDALVEKAGVTVNLAERDTILRQANRLVQDQVAVIPLHYGTDLYGIVKDRGIQFTPRPDRWLVYKDMDKK
ncbi:MAG TPA: ABC transporter substrate-binding protein, partial [Candidatus Acidoferrum sp.]|nr:ABC transporter substrate-binding protein [Candidatus Acidoferrum sp.]